MQTTLQETLKRLLTAIEQVAGGARAYSLLRAGRFAQLCDADRNVLHSIPSNAIDEITSPTLASAAAEHLRSLPDHVNASDLILWPITGNPGHTLGLFCIAATDLPEPAKPAIESIARTLGVLVDSLDCTSLYATRSLHDALTHLPNRAMFIERLTDELAVAQRTNNHVGAFTIDLDGFTEINNTHGRAFGDRVLQRIAARLHHAVRRSDLLARLSEDEFGLMAVQLNDQPEGAHVASRLLKVINQPMEVDGISLTLSASVGIAVYPCDGIDAETLLGNSHAAMHRAKIRGSNQFEYFTPQMNADAMERLELESRLRLAVEKNQLTLHYQPIVDRDGKITSVEALVRWYHPEQGLISPAKFIPIAEQTGLIVPIGTWVLKQAAQQAAQWAIERLPIRVNVNVSTLQFSKSDFVDIVNDAIQRSNLDPSLLELELTESVFIIDEGEIARKLAWLRESGVRIAIDDFGAGYSNLSRLHNLPIDTLKIDKAFVNEITRHDSVTPLHHRTAVLRAMATLGNSLGLRLVAEGVESDDQVTFLKRVGYEAMQGFFFSKPVPAEEIPELARKMGLAKRVKRVALSAAA